MDYVRTARDTGQGFQLGHALVWCFWTQEFPDLLHIRDYDADFNCEEYYQAMCGTVELVDADMSSAQFILGNPTLCADCRKAYTYYGGSQVPKDETI